MGKIQRERKLHAEKSRQIMATRGAKKEHVTVSLITVVYSGLKITLCDHSGGQGSLRRGWGYLDLLSPSSSSVHMLLHQAGRVVFRRSFSFENRNWKLRRLYGQWGSFRTGSVLAELVHFALPVGDLPPFRMAFHMLGQVVTAHEFPRADWAFESLLSGMGAPVAGQFIGSCEAFAASIPRAFERLLSSVCAKMGL